VTFTKGADRTPSTIIVTGAPRVLLARVDHILKRGQRDFKRKEQYAVLLELRRLLGRPGERPAP